MKLSMYCALKQELKNSKEQILHIKVSEPKCIVINKKQV
jgi:hypothetical protein